jgi:nitronate monooxygenase
MAKLEADLVEARRAFGGSPSSGLLPVGVAFITGHGSVSSFEATALPLLREHRPAAVWLFAPDERVKPHARIIAAVRATLEPPTRVFVQVGNVSAAREAVADGADVLVCQGIDAGGHQFRRGMGVASLVPAVRTMLDEDFPDKDVAILAAGGISDGRGLAAALALGESLFL